MEGTKPNQIRFYNANYVHTDSPELVSLLERGAPKMSYICLQPQGSSLLTVIAHIEKPNERFSASIGRESGYFFVDCRSEFSSQTQLDRPYNPSNKPVKELDQGDLDLRVRNAMIGNKQFYNSTLMNLFEYFCTIAVEDTRGASIETRAQNILDAVESVYRAIRTAGHGILGAQMPPTSRFPVPGAGSDYV